MDCPGAAAHKRQVPGESPKPRSPPTHTQLRNSTAHTVQPPHFGCLKLEVQARYACVGRSRGLAHVGDPRELWALSSPKYAGSKQLVLPRPLWGPPTAMGGEGHTLWESVTLSTVPMPPSFPRFLFAPSTSVTTTYVRGWGRGCALGRN